MWKCTDYLGATLYARVGRRGRGGFDRCPRKGCLLPVALLFWGDRLLSCTLTLFSFWSRSAWRIGGNARCGNMLPRVIDIAVLHRNDEGWQCVSCAPSTLCVLYVPGGTLRVCEVCEVGGEQSAVYDYHSAVLLYKYACAVSSLVVFVA